MDSRQHGVRVAWGSATVPYGYESDFLRPIYPVDQVSLDKFLDDKQIKKAKGYMTNKGWVHSLARTGR